MPTLKLYPWVLPGLSLIVAALSGANGYVVVVLFALGLLTSVVFVLWRTVGGFIAVLHKQPLAPIGRNGWFIVLGVNVLVSFFVAGFSLQAAGPPGGALKNAESVRPKILAEYKSKIASGAVNDESPSNDPKLAAKLGKTRFAEAYRLNDWAALYVVTSPQCDKLIGIDVSDETIRSALVWFADCQNGERFIVTEENAKLTEQKLSHYRDNDPVDISGLKAMPQSAAFAHFDEALAAAHCDFVMQDLLRSKGSYSPAWQWDTTQHPNNGRVTIVRNFTARNAFNAKIDSQYDCLVDARDNSVIRIKFFDGGDWQTVSIP